MTGVSGARVVLTATVALVVAGSASAAPARVPVEGTPSSVGAITNTPSVSADQPGPRAQSDQRPVARTVDPSGSTGTFCRGACPIQPGAFLSTPEGGCTMNFVFQGSNGKLYIGTAGHCFEKVGQRAEAEPNPGSPLSILDPLFEFGTAVFIESDVNDPSIDFALIRIDSAYYGKVNPRVRFWGGPTGVTDDRETATGDLLLSYGYGLGFDLIPATRPRPRVLLDDDDTHYRSQSPSNFGDSGSPIIHRETRKALGIDSRFNLGDLPPTTDAGPTVENILRRLAAAGWNVRLLTSDIGAFQPQPPVQPPPQSQPPVQSPPQPQSCAGQVATIIASPGDDVTLGTPDRDVIVGSAEADVIRSFGGKDLICARKGADLADGGKGRDRIFGQKGPDRLKGKGGRDKLKGAKGRDLLKGGKKADLLRGGAKRDRLRGGGGADRLFGGKGNDSCNGGAGTDALQNC